MEEENTNMEKFDVMEPDKPINDNGSKMQNQKKKKKNQRKKVAISPQRILY